MSEDDWGWLGDAIAATGRNVDTWAPPVRVELQLRTGRTLSTLRWGHGRPQIVFLHGGGQNAHTWDLVAALMDRPSLAIDLPGHGHSSWRDDRDYSPRTNAAAVAEALEQLATGPCVVVGMSLGGLTTIALASDHPSAISAAVIVDVVPYPEPTAQDRELADDGAVALIWGAREFESLDAMVDAAVESAPNRLREHLRRGVINNSIETEGGRRRWRYDALDPDVVATSAGAVTWSDVESLHCPVMLVLGADSPFVSPVQLGRFRAALPGARVETVQGAGHAVQSQQPIAISELITDFVDGEVALRSR